MTPDVRREVLRKILHMAMGLFALSLRWLTPWQAALCALAAIAHNLWLFPHYGMRKLERPEEKARGYSGMIGYPCVVLVLILLCWRPFQQPCLQIAAAAWAILAFGDAGAALCGIFLGGPALPWNRQKRWSGWAGFAVIGTLFGAFWWSFVAAGRLPPSSPVGGSGFWSLWGMVLLAAVLAGLVETLPGQLDDNLTVPLAAWLVLSFTDWHHLFSAIRIQFFDEMAFWPTVIVNISLLPLNALLGLTAWRLRWVSASSCLLGILFGTSVIVGMGWLGYGFLLLFYFSSQFSTYFGNRIKKERGIAEPDEGRRSVGSVFSKGIVPAFFVLFSPLAFIASLAVYAADTVASEFGKTSKGAALLLAPFRRVPAGTPGAVSFRGTLAGILVLFVFCAAACWAGTAHDPALFAGDMDRLSTGDSAWMWVPPSLVLALVGSAAAAMLATFFLESILNERVVARGLFSKEVIHLFTGALAGCLSFGLFRLSSIAFYLVLRFSSGGLP